uniref:Glycosyltransferase family 92 protein n=1 Tax=Strongyloides venezuelensis TaxID=75913 RepID=A0A0K0F5Q5_STRVS
MRNDPLFGKSYGVVIVTMLTTNIKLFSFLCYTKNENNAILKKGKFILNKNNFNKTCQYTTLFFTCPILEDSKVLGIIDDSRSDSKIFSYFLNKTFKKVDITVCYGSLFMFNDIEKFVLSSEMFLYNNVDRIQVYFKSGRLNEWNLLKKYRDSRNDKIHIKRMASFFNEGISHKNYRDTVADHLWFSSKEATSMDCFLKYRNSKFVIFSNYDEVLMENKNFKSYLIKSIFFNPRVENIFLNVVNSKNGHIINKRKIIVNENAKNINLGDWTSKNAYLKFALTSLKHSSDYFYIKVPHEIVRNVQNFFQTNNSILSILKKKEEKNIYLLEYVSRCGFYFDISTKCQKISSWCIRESEKIKKFKCIYMWNNYQIHKPNIRTTFIEATCCKYFNFNGSCPMIIDPIAMKGKEKHCENEL